jgi:ATP-dependent DNA helicase RecG
MADLDMGTVATFLERRAGRSKTAGRFDDLVELLLKTRCVVETVDTSGQKVLRPTGAGLLLFGHNPQDFILHAEVVCVLYPDEVGLRRYIDRRNLRGPITAQIDQAEAFLKQYTAVGARIEGFHRIDEPEYALEALREAVVNAVVHRDYSLRGEKVRLFYYPDRIEIHSPGLLMPGISLSELSQGKTRSKPRNTIIASLLPEFPGGYMEQLGTGISFMINQCRALNQPAPQFREQGEFIVIFRGQGSSELTPALPAPAPTPVASSVELELPVAPMENLSQVRRQELALRYVQKYGAITNGEYRTIVKVSEATARRDLELLVEQGSLRAIGTKRARKYLLE